jgi:hypothetical protein
MLISLSKNKILVNKNNFGGSRGSCDLLIHHNTDVTLPVTENESALSGQSVMVRIQNMSQGMGKTGIGAVLVMHISRRN